MQRAKISRGEFIRLGTALGVGAAGALTLTACGGSGTGGEGAGAGGGEGAGGDGAGRNAQSTPGGSSGGETSGGRVIASASEVRPGSAVEFEDSGNPAVLVRLDNGEFVAYSAVCTHQQCTVAYRDGLLACPCHGSVFDPAQDGQVVTPPARVPLPEIAVEVRDGQVVKA